jgi:hypothetical protein
MFLKNSHHLELNIRRKKKILDNDEQHKVTHDTRNQRTDITNSIDKMNTIKTQNNKSYQKIIRQQRQKNPARQTTFEAPSSSDTDNDIQEKQNATKDLRDRYSSTRMPAASIKSDKHQFSSIYQATSLIIPAIPPTKLLRSLQDNTRYPSE